MTPAVFSRDTMKQQIKETAQWDVLIIGGGASGLGIALEAVSRGYKTLLAERHDFAKGTSSRSTKLVHGGVRYLAQGHIKLVREASIERGRLYKNAPHLVKDQVFIVPVYSWWHLFQYTIGLKLYDRIAGSYRLGPSEYISKKEVLEKLPGINPEKLAGGIQYHDGQFDDARLAINLAQTIAEQHGTLLNYCAVTQLSKNNEGLLNGAALKDQLTGEIFSVNAKVIVNATGVFADDILQMDEPAAKKSICTSQGIHLVVDKKFLPSQQALMIPRTTDGRVLFAVPWHDKLVIGTTDTLVNTVSEEPEALQQEIDFILQNAAAYLTTAPARKDVLSVFAGLRPLAMPAEGKQKTKEISRSHKIAVSASQLFTMLGGKWTTYRKMAEDMMNKIEIVLRWPAKRSVTQNMPVHGYEKNVPGSMAIYGSDEKMIREKINDDPGGWLDHSLQIHKAHVVHAVQYEFAQTPEDVLSRRTRALFLDASAAKKLALPVAAVMAPLLQKDERWIQEQVQQFEHLANSYCIK